MDARVIEVADFKSEVKFDPWGRWGHLEAAMASEATKMAIRGNMHMDTRVIEVADFKSEVKFDLWGYRGYLVADMASGDVKMAVLGNIHMYIRVIEISDFWFQIWCQILTFEFITMHFCPLV